MTAGTWQRFCGLSARERGELGADEPAPKPTPGPARPFRVRGVLEVELEVFAQDEAEAAREARTALEDVGARVDALPNVWAAGGELSDPEEAS